MSSSPLTSQNLRASMLRGPATVASQGPYGAVIWSCTRGTIRCLPADARSPATREAFLMRYETDAWIRVHATTHLVVEASSGPVVAQKPRVPSVQCQCESSHHHMATLASVASGHTLKLRERHPPVVGGSQPSLTVIITVNQP
jgi:hypothetical protein